MPVIPARGGAGRKEREREGKINTKRGKKKRKFSQPVEIRLYVAGFKLYFVFFKKLRFAVAYLPIWKTTFYHIRSRVLYQLRSCIYLTY